MSGRRFAIRKGGWCGSALGIRATGSSLSSATNWMHDVVLVISPPFESMLSCWRNEGIGLDHWASNCVAQNLLQRHFRGRKGWELTSLSLPFTPINQGGSTVKISLKQVNSMTCMVDPSTCGLHVLKVTSIDGLNPWDYVTGCGITCLWQKYTFLGKVLIAFIKFSKVPMILVKRDVKCSKGPYHINPFLCKSWLGTY